jgi:hypothetical protein
MGCPSLRRISRRCTTALDFSKGITIHRMVVVLHDRREVVFLLDVGDGLRDRRYIPLVDVHSSNMLRRPRCLNPSSCIPPPSEQFPRNRTGGLSILNEHGTVDHGGQKPRRSLL